MFILAEVEDEYKVFFISSASFNILGGLMKWGVRKKTHEKRLKILYFSFFYSKNMNTFYVV